MNMMQYIKIRHKYAAGKSKTYKGLSRICMEMANERVYDHRTGNGRRNDMDADALAAEKEQRQAEFAAADYRDYGADQEYTEQEWIDWEACLQEEVNWLGTRGKDGGKWQQRRRERQRERQREDRQGQRQRKLWIV